MAVEITKMSSKDKLTQQLTTIAKEGKTRLQKKGLKEEDINQNSRKKSR
jgi:hypothetical protein